MVIWFEAITGAKCPIFVKLAVCFWIARFFFLTFFRLNGAVATFQNNMMMIFVCSSYVIPFYTCKGSFCSNFQYYCSVMLNFMLFCDLPYPIYPIHFYVLNSSYDNHISFCYDQYWNNRIFFMIFCDLDFW